ncbi:sensor histidine kinase [Streptomyces sp. N50]|uniref:sensor histidine kinase n=1 Tax=Streptomyces sp. N50 TaxID=3081765 RepID=UPI0029625423|nr:histidine kinase [Streptomyces sp. N50]WOX16715.1 histidine kinase [Streptomyces sp. N50]
MHDSLQRYADEHIRTVDTMSAVLLFAMFLFGSELGAPGGPRPDAVGPTITLAAVSCAALLWQRGRPRTVVTVTAVAAAGASALGHLLTPLLLGPLMLALYRLAVLTDRTTARRCFLASVALVVTTATVVDPVHHPWPFRTVGPAAWLLLPVVAGNAVRLREAYLEAVQARAEYAERSREEEARHRVAEERMRIARELHDVVAHHLALAHAQAGTAAHLAGTHPEHVRRILTELAGTTSSALREMKGTVGLLRQPDDPGAPLTPSPGLTQLAELTRAFRSSGLTVTVTTEGEPHPLSPGVDLTAYRIVQEALTNVSKHTLSRSARVRLRYSYDRLTVTVTDDGVGAGGAAGPAPGRGVGQTGMRESARLVGGGLRSGRRGGGGDGANAATATEPAPAHGFGLNGIRARVRSVDNTLQAEHPAEITARGFGLIGMRERARSVGGVLQAGHRVEGGFEVTTELPLYPSAPESAEGTP